MVADRLDNLDIAKPQQESHGFWQDDVLRPIYNGAVATPLNALRTIAEPVVASTTGVELPRVAELAVAKDDSLPGWLVQNVTGGVASLAPYLVASRFAGGMLKSAGAAAGLEGTAAKLATSDRFAMVTGAAGYDFLRDSNPNGTTLRERFANAAGGAAAFYTFGVGNALVAESALAPKLIGRAVTGALGTDIQVATTGLIGGKPINFDDMKDAAVSGMAMNLILPFAHEKLASGADAIASRLGRGIPAARFIEKEGLAGRTEGLNEALDKVPFTRIQTGERATGKHTLLFDDWRQSELASSQAIAKGATPDQVREATLNARAEHLRTQLLNQGLKENDYVPSPVMTNDQIASAIKEGRIKIEPAPKPGEFYENGVDVGLNSMFMKLPRGEHTDFADPNAAKSALRRWAKEGRELEYKDGITLAPGETALGFTDISLTLPRVPQRTAGGAIQEWSGAPITASLNQKSSIARNFITNHETAPALNNNSTAHKIVYEITNHSPNVVTLQPGMRFGSLQFHELGAFPAEVERYKTGSVKGQTSLAGADHSAGTSSISGGSSPVVRDILPTALEYTKLSPFEQLRYRPDLQDAYANVIKSKLDPSNTLSDHELISREAPQLLPKGS
jgi:deoxycytidine triphosphate deaminase